MSAKPLVSLLVLAYNQERYIDQAIDGALAQKYEPLEIIFSDDASSDGTWARIQARAEEYSGPHRIRIRREPTNVGTLDHVLNAVEESNGELLVLAAGDDISYPERVARLVELWKNSGADAVCSGLDIIDEQGKIEVAGVKGTGGGQPRKWFGYPADQDLIKGCTAAYSRQLFHGLPRSGTHVLHEDIVMNSWMIVKERQVARFDEPMIGYRRHFEAISYSGVGESYKSWLRAENCRIAHSSDYIRLYDYLLKLLPSVDSSLSDEQLEKAATGIERARELALLRSEYYQAGIFRRIQKIADSRYRSERKNLAARLFGPNIYARLKAAANWLPRRAT